VALTVRVDDASRSWHVPLLLAPFSLTTYRGS
jgi:5-hydroxyisourate hydrolase-like protein (transthyretin family)